MAFHRKRELQNLVTPPVPPSTFYDLLKSGKIPPADAYIGRSPLWSDETFERVKQNFLNAARPPRKRSAKRGAAAEPTTPAI